jgi:hypothetical protein
MHRTAPSLSILRHLVTLALAAPLVACVAEGPDAPPISAEDSRVADLVADLADVPGELVITSTADLPASPDLRERLAAAGKVIHVFADDRVIAYVGSAANAPEGVAVERLFREHGGDIVIGDQRYLAEYLAQEEHLTDKDGVSEAVGLPIGTGGLWPDSTVAYVIDGALSASEADAIRNAISTWNTKVDPSGAQIKVRFIPRYWADGRPYIRFVKGGSGCGSSMVGRHDHIFSSWWSHDITINCFSENVIHHEMGHTAGLYHEQQRCDRDSFVNVRATSDGVNCARLCGGNSASYGPYNYLSVMHYGYSSDPAACSIAPITPMSSYYRGTPGQAGSAPSLDSYDVQALNQMYYDRRSLPRVGPGIYYTLVPQYTSKAVAVPASSQANGAGLVLFDRWPGWLDQHFSIRNTVEGYVELRPRHATGQNKCVENLSFSLSNGGPIGQWDCWGGPNQAWILAPAAGAPGYYDIINRYSGKSFDVAGWGTANGTPIQQWDHTNNTNQRFQLSPAW